MRSPPTTENEPPSDPPYLNATASWYTQPAWKLFAEIADRCGLETAKFLFKRCIDVAEEQEERRRDRENRHKRKRDAAPWRLPKLAQIKTADRLQICKWWDRFSSTSQIPRTRDEPIISALAARYVEVGGYPADYKPGRLPPIKRPGSVKRSNPKAQLPAMFNADDPNSAYSREKVKRGGKLTQEAFAETLTPKFGSDVENVLANLRYYRRRAKT